MNKFKIINKNNFNLIFNQFNLDQSIKQFNRSSFQIINNNKSYNNIFTIKQINKFLKRKILNNKNNNTNCKNNNKFKINFEFNEKQWNKEQHHQYFRSAKTSNVIYLLIAINTAAFLYINSNDSYEHQRFVRDNFMLSLDTFEKKPTTLITSFFSHQGFGHFLFNMIGLYSIGPMILNTVGTSSFLGLYMASGIASGLGFLALQKYFRDQNKSMGGFDFFGQKGSQYIYNQKRSSDRALGASGAIYGVLATFACLYPTATLSLYGIIPIPAMIAVGGFFAYDMYMEIFRPGAGNVCHAGHLAGGVYGILYYLISLRGRYSR